ncbi:hypothetical protein H9Q10_09545 [Eikenella sp. S3360]|uniref:Uncharacterized protein n=1 Tax=Eikenella glucosivorans TaxID=2766967 RepID=A0ABS0NC74_9NEIS|nr:hypothetical protein [Eikenella glucosivorans]MBH5329908.1 hypothetical protein [Eikenella glucosivorans]
MPVPTHLQAYVRLGSLHSPDQTEYRFAIALDGASRFRIRYYGELCDGLITDTEAAPAKITAVEPESGREILLFDGGRHGYNAMLCDEYSEETLANRPLQDLDDTLYQIEIRAFYNIDYAAEREDFCDENGKIELANGNTVSFEQLQQDGMDALVIELISPQGKRREIVNEELA